MRAFMIIAMLLMAARTMHAQDSSAARIAEGKRVFEGRAGGALCFSCHGMNAKGLPSVGPDLTDTTWLHGDGSTDFLVTIIRAGVPKPKKSIAAMPPMGGARLTDDQLRAVATYIASLSTSRPRP